jgi:hypothetical protein
VNGLAATSAAISPSGVAVDAAGNLYIASGYVLRVGPDGIMSILTSIHQTGTYYGGSRGYFLCSPSGDGGLSAFATVFAAPVGFPWMQPVIYTWRKMAGSGRSQRTGVSIPLQAAIIAA